ncbi:EthD family reductase [Alicyclobacillus tolerans]|uniref:EthD family reductase n=1 Tax=Alicyclobacillus tolerans TaxID=90970 RepID=UPI001EFF8202|nr:EthD family reductase [Alicyclobacillus tolerans]MCF8566491.1 EthD family reductase [Alicyclobacillus tolerans]
MAKVVVLYEQPKDVDAFESHYYGVHIPLVQKVPNLKNASIHRIQNAQHTEAQMYLMAELEFEDANALQATMATPEWQEVAKDLPNLVVSLHKPPVILITD